MGCLTAKASGEIASFINPTVTPIESAKVYFTPTQLGSGTPSPDNVREIVGRTSVELYHSGRNIAHIIGYSAINSDSNNTRSISNKYGTTINTTEFSLPDTKLVISQSQYPNTSTIYSYANGYIGVLVDNLIWKQSYNVSFKIQDITSNPLNVSLQYIKLLVPSGGSYQPEINGDKLLFKNVVWKPHSTAVGRHNFEIRNCGMSFTLSEFMVTPADDDNYDFKPYQGTTYSIDWTDDVGNIYGGYVDLAKGEIVEEYKYLRLDANTPCSEFKIMDSGLYTVWYHINDMASGGIQTFYNDSNIICNSIKKVLSRGSIPTTQLGILFGNNSNNIYLYNMNSVYGYTTIEEVSAWLDENPIYVTLPLADPIIHQLTPQQLQTFKNENNIWSDGDSVEVDYDLAETFDIQKAKRKIIMNQPHIETLTGDIISFTTDMKAPLKECKVSFMPVQEGSGDPSPSNVRNITGWNGVNVNSGSNVYSVDWTDDVGSVYSGYVDLISGELVQDMAYKQITSEWLSSRESGYIGYTSSITALGGVSGVWVRNAFNSTARERKSGGIKANCNVFKVLMNSTNVSSSQNRTAFAVDNESITSVADFISVVETLEQNNNGLYLAYELETPITYQLTPQQILSFKGINNFSCGIKNDMNIKYWKHKLSDSENIAYEAENLTFDGTNYIDTGVYLFSEKNLNKDFEVVIEDLYGNSGAGSITIVCAKYDSTAVGFLIRLNSSTSTTYNGTIFMKPNNHNNITIKRVNGVITIDGEVITNPKIKFTNTIHNHPLVLGCALQDDGTPMRYATGTIGHITVKWL